jgi:hypothetical protein
MRKPRAPQTTLSEIDYASMLPPHDDSGKSAAVEHIRTPIPLSAARGPPWERATQILCGGWLSVQGERHDLVGHLPLTLCGSDQE